MIFNETIHHISIQVRASTVKDVDSHYLWELIHLKSQVQINICVSWVELIICGICPLFVGAVLYFLELFNFCGSCLPFVGAANYLWELSTTCGICPIFIGCDPP